MNAATPRKIDSGSLFTGTMLAAVGALFLLDNLRIADFGDVVQVWWPMIIVLLGVPKLFARETVWAGLWLIAIGVWLQITVLRLFGLTFQNSWPLLLIVMGAGMTLRALMDAAHAPSKEDHHES